MEKQKADETITLYLEKIYGFAFKKAYSYDEAEELASEMTAEVYTSLLSSDEIFNVSGYIWRICENVYARYVAKIKKQEGLCENYMAASAAHMDEGISDEEKYRIRREISMKRAARDFSDGDRRSTGRLERSSSRALRRRGLRSMK